MASSLQKTGAPRLTVKMDVSIFKRGVDSYGNGNTYLSRLATECIFERVNTQLEPCVVLGPVASQLRGYTDHQHFSMMETIFTI